MTLISLNRLSILALVFLSGCASSVPDVMTYEEYRQVHHVAPYVLDLSAGAGRLVYVGSRHTNDPSSLDVTIIEELWKQLKPDAAFNEGGDPPALAEREKAVQIHGEAGLLRHFAKVDGVPVASLDPTKAEQVAALAGTFSTEELKLFYCLLQVQHHRKNPVEPFEERMERVFRVLGAVPGLGVAPTTLPELEGLFRSYFPGQGGFRDVPSSWFDPVEDESLLNEIARRSGEVRDAHVVNLLVSRVLAGERVFAVMGASHVVMQEAALRARLARSLPNNSLHRTRLTARR